MLFDNTKRAFHLKTDYDLKKALIIFKLISSKRLVSIGSRLVYFLYKINMSINFLFNKPISFENYFIYLLLNIFG